MKFATILRESGFSVKDFKKSSEISIILYDRKDRIDNVEDIKFVHTLFSNNTKSFIDFYEFVKELENNPEPPACINVKIDEYSVVVFYKTPQAKVFLRKEGINPMDFMD